MRDECYAVQGPVDSLAQSAQQILADNQDLIKRMRDAGLMMVLSGYETNDANTLEALQKDNSRQNNLTAAKLLKAAINSAAEDYLDFLAE